MMAEHIRIIVLLLVLLGRNIYVAAVVVAAAMIFSLIYWRSIKIVAANGYLCINKGVIIRRKARVKITDISAVIATRSIVDIITGSTSVKIFTEAGAVCGKSGIKIFAQSRDELSILLGFVEYGEKRKSTLFQTFLLALSTTSAITGIVFTLTLMKKIDSAITNKESAIEKIEKIGKFSERIFGLPPLLNMVIIIFLIAIGTSLAFFVAKQVGHTSVCNKKTASITFGIIPKSRVALRKRAINGVFYVQTPILRFLDKNFLKADIAGVNYTRKNELYLSLPVPKRINSTLSLDFYDFTHKKTKGLETNKGAEKWRYFSIPFLFFSAVSIVLLMVKTIFPWVSELITVFATILIVIFLYRLYLAKYAYLNTKIDLIEGNAHFIKKASIIIAKFNTEKIGQITLTTYPFDRRTGTCTVKADLRSENTARIKMKYMASREINKQLKILQGYTE